MKINPDFNISAMFSNRKCHLTESDTTITQQRSLTSRLCSVKNLAEDGFTIQSPAFVNYLSFNKFFSAIRADLIRATSNTPQPLADNSVSPGGG